MAKVTLANGAVIEGTPDQIANVLKAMGTTLPPHLYYNSSTHGPILISEMNEAHLRNAALKIFREWADGLSTKHGRELITALRNSCVDPTFVALLSAYAKKVL